MSCNNQKPHLLVLPEDDANRQMANGFALHYRLKNERSLQVLPVAKGWGGVLRCFKEDHIPELRKYPERRMVLLIDFDDMLDGRRETFFEAIPEELKNRVFVLGVASEPEKLKKSVNISYEKIGETLAGECAENQQHLWQHELLKHNSSELTGLLEQVRPFLFE